MKRVWFVWLVCILAVCMVLPLPMAAAECAVDEVYLGGIPLGINTAEDGLVVMGFAELGTEQGPRCPAKEAGMAVGDVLLSVDGSPTRTRHEVQAALDLAEGGQVTLHVLRDGRRKDLLASPVSAEGGWLLGVYLRDGVQGVGTLTYVRCDDHRYGALGHGIEDGTAGMLAGIYHGRVYATRISQIVEGRVGAPGQLQAPVGEGDAIGSIQSNTSLGLFGHAQPAMYADLTRVKVGGMATAHEGDAVLVCALGADKPHHYAVRITQCRRQSSAQPKGMRIRVTDPRLLSLTGGIVQGMSGSPILQDGLLIGAVTHVTVDDPAEGYGVYIDFMLQQQG